VELLGLFLERTVDSYRSLRLVLQLRARAGALIDSAVISTAELIGDDDRGCDLNVADSGVAVSRECIIPQGCPAVGKEIGERRYLIKNGKIESKYVTISRVTPPCAGE
jgi:hypothetical protein